MRIRLRAEKFWISAGRHPIGLRAAVLASAVLLMIPGALGHSVTTVEYCQLPAGLDAWQRHGFGVYRVCGPLSKLLYALPAQLAGVRLGHPRELDDDPLYRREWEVGRYFQDQHPEQYLSFYRWSRLVPIVMTLLGGWLLCQWSTRLFGTGAGIVSLCVWCWMPPVLAHGSLITSDLPAATLFLLAAFWFWKFLIEPRLLGAILAGASLGLAISTKFTLLILVPCWVVLLIGRAWQLVAGNSENLPAVRTSGKLASYGAVLFTTALIVINAMYFFDGFGLSFNEWGVGQSSVCRELKHLGDSPATAWLLRVRWPIPVEFARGLDTQLANTEIPQSGYLMGRVQPGGFWYWYPAAAVFKLPIAAWLLMAVGLWALVQEWPGDDLTLWAALCTLMPAANLALIVAGTTGTGNNAAFRYLIPTLAMICLWVGRAWVDGRPILQRLTVGLLVWLAVSALTGMGDFIGWQNSIGWLCSRGGRPALVGDSLDWGQDLDRLGQWTARHAREGSTWTCVYGQGSGEPYGLQAPYAYAEAGHGSAYLAVSENILAGYDEFQTLSINSVTPRMTPALREWIDHKRPYETIGNSIRIYQINESAEGPWRLP